MSQKQQRADQRSEWLGKKLVLALRAAALSRAGLARLLQEQGIDVTRQAVYDWCKTGRVAKENLPAVAHAVGLKVEYFLSPAAPPEPVLTDADVSPKESNLVLAFRDLLPEQQEQFLKAVQEQAERNRAIGEQYANRYGPRPIDAPKLPAPKRKKPRTSA